MPPKFLPSSKSPCSSGELERAESHAAAQRHENLPVREGRLPEVYDSREGLHLNVKTRLTPAGKCSSPALGSSAPGEIPAVLGE